MSDIQLRHNFKNHWDLDISSRTVLKHSSNSLSIETQALLQCKCFQILWIIIRTAVMRTTFWDVILKMRVEEDLESLWVILSQRDECSLWINVSVWEDEKQHEPTHLFHIRLRLSIKEDYVQLLLITHNPLQHSSLE